MFQRQAILFIFAGACLCQAAIGAVTPAWTSLGGSAQRRGLSPFNGPLTGCVKMAVAMPSPIYTGILAGPDGSIYATSEDSFYKVTGLGGNVTILQNDLPAKTTSSPTMGPGGTIYVGCEDGRLLALDGEGNVKWTFTTEAMIIGAPAVAADGKVFVGSTDGKVYCLDANGNALWQWTSPRAAAGSSAIVAPPTLAVDGSVLVADVYWPVLYALSPTNGSVRWQVDFTMEITGKTQWPDGVLKSVPIMYGHLVSAPAVGPDGSIYVTLDGVSRFCAISPTGHRTWSTEVSYPPSSGVASNLFTPYYNHTPCLVSVSSWSEAVVGPDGTVYLNMDDPLIRAIDPGGAVKWVTRCGLQGGFKLTVSADGLIYACGDEGSMYVLQPDGSLACVFDGEGWMSYPVIAADGTVYVSDSAGFIWAIGRDCPTVNTPALHRMADAKAPRGVNFVDYAAVLNDWLKTTRDYKGLYTSTPSDPRLQTDKRFLATDVNRDAYVDILDIAAIADQWLQN
jgi:outer membrane protein assembly factor BamB